MNAYVIADAIDKFTKKYKELVSERNKIERDKLNFEKEKLAFEKEKFEFSKQLESDKSSNNNLENECPHNWVFDAVYNIPYDFTRKERYVCSICGKDKWETIEYTFKT